MKENKFTLIDENGIEKEYDVLFTYESEETKKHYIAYTDNSLDESGNVQVYASTYDPTNPNSRLDPIETEKEWKIVETILETLQEEVKKILRSPLKWVLCAVLLLNIFIILINYFEFKKQVGDVKAYNVFANQYEGELEIGRAHV